ncbi:hypothetical protein Pdw03_2968 [Penicillium digitatum]|uniref:Uncharacterized protein n=1 Tax=Penicillium digitatum TaxID=36651 RepID=A0A7T7BHM8_PENDI|nr:hypothetical protein Pdw03_2968 [Penicillium digitatum]
MHAVALTGWLVLGRLLIYDPHESIGENPRKSGALLQGISTRGGPLPAIITGKDGINLTPKADLVILSASQEEWIQRRTDPSSPERNFESRTF